MMGQLESSRDGDPIETNPTGTERAEGSPMSSSAAPTTRHTYPSALPEIS